MDVSPKMLKDAAEVGALYGDKFGVFIICYFEEISDSLFNLNLKGEGIYVRILRIDPAEVRALTRISIKRNDQRIRLKHSSTWTINKTDIFLLVSALERFSCESLT